MSVVSFALAVVCITRLFSTSAFRATKSLHRNEIDFRVLRQIYVDKIWPFELSELCRPGFDSLHRKTRGSCTLDKVKSFLRNQQLDLSKRLSVCTDGAPSIIGKAAGAVDLL